MENQRQPSGSYFGPKPRISTRSKAANGPTRRNRFRSKRMNKIAKDMEKRKAYMPLNVVKRNDRSGASVTDSAHVHGGNVLPMKKNGTSKSNQSFSHISRNAKQSPTSRLENNLVPLMDIKSPNPYRVKPSKELENLTPLRSKDGSNAKLGDQKQSHFRNRTSHPVDSGVMAKLAHQARNLDALNIDDDTSSSESNGRLDLSQGQEISVRKGAKEISSPLKCKRKATFMKDKNNAIASSKDVAESEFTKIRLHEKDQSIGYVGKNSYVNSKRKKKEEKLTTYDDGDTTRVMQQDNLTCGMIKKTRYMPSNEEDGDEVGGCKKNLTNGDGTIGLTPQKVVLKDRVKKQCNYCLKPISNPPWSGIFKMGCNEYVSLAGHLSTQSCEKVWELSKSLPPVVEVERVSKLVAWPRIWNVSKPSTNNIGMYFLPPNMRHDEELDQLVNEVMENDLLLRAVVNEAEMLVFPSVLLPKRYQMFQGKYFLWAVFQPREDKDAVLAEPLNGSQAAACFKPAN